MALKEAFSPSLPSWDKVQSIRERCVLCGKLLQDEFLQPGKSGCQELSQYDRYMTFQISFLAWPSYGWITLGSACSMPSVARRVGRTEVSGLGGSSEAWCLPVTYSSTSSRLLNVSEPVSKSPMLLGGSSSESFLLGGCMMQ